MPRRSPDQSCSGGFEVELPGASKPQFIEHASQVEPPVVELGAFRVVQAWGVDVLDGKLTDVRRAVTTLAIRRCASAAGA